jgi:shikimate kinase
VRGQLKALTQEREPLYTEVATIQIDTADREPGDIAAQIIDELDLVGPQVSSE